MIKSFQIALLIVSAVAVLLLAVVALPLLLLFAGLVSFLEKQGLRSVPEGDFRQLIDQDRYHLP